jgi:hypothetical protein
MHPKLFPMIDDAEYEIDEGTPERNLVAAVIYRAMNDLLEPQNCKSAIGWFEYGGKPNNKSLQFKQCCDYLGWEWRPVYKKAMEIYHWTQDQREEQSKVQQLLKIPLKKSPLAAEITLTTSQEPQP